MKNIILAIMLALTPLIATAEADKTYVLTYQKSNRWIAVNDAQPLRQLIKDAKVSGNKYFRVELPKEKRKLTIARLVVLRDMLEKQLKHGVIIEEVEPYAPKANTVIVKVTGKK